MDFDHSLYPTEWILGAMIRTRKTNNESLWIASMNQIYMDDMDLKMVGGAMIFLRPATVPRKQPYLKLVTVLAL